MKTILTKSALAPDAQRLVEKMQRINFGRLENLLFRDGLPVFNPTPRIILDIKLGSQSRNRHEIDLPDFDLRTEVVDLFRQLSIFRDGRIESLEIREGLPCRMRVEALLA